MSDPGMTSADLPEGHGPEAFLRDEDLVAYWEREVAARPADPVAARALRQARLAAVLTPIAIANQEQEARDREAAEAAEAAAFEAMTPKEQEAEVLRKFRESRKEQQ